MKDNTFSIIIPAYSRINKLERAVRSVISQTYPNWELIVVNDGGPQFELPQDSRIKIFEQPHLNRCFARNLGMKESKNNWICWLDSDDAYINVYLEVLNQFIN